MTADEPLLVVEGLTTTFDTDDGDLVAVDGIDFTVEAGEIVCLVGESGSGKTVATESITRIVDSPPGRLEGSVRFRGRDLPSMGEPELRAVRGYEIAHVFQNPQDALNHCYTVGWQVVEALQVHEDVADETARTRAIDLLDRVGLANASSLFDAYPHELSGGQKQRVMIAMALIGDPDLLIADEPTTALDVTVQAQILRLLDDLRREFDMGILLVTHDLGVVAEVADRVVVMYAGKVMERGSVLDVFERPAHPYTRGLLDCLPGTGGTEGGIPGTLPDPIDPPEGCRFAARCAYAEDACRTGEQPAEIEADPGQFVSCIHYRPDRDESVLEETDRRTTGSDPGAGGVPDGGVSDGGVPDGGVSTDE